MSCGCKRHQLEDARPNFCIIAAAVSAFTRRCCKRFDFALESIHSSSFTAILFPSNFSQRPAPLDGPGFLPKSAYPLL